MKRQRISQSVQSSVDGAAGQPERFIGLEYRGELDDPEPTDIDQRPGTIRDLTTREIGELYAAVGL